jgi:hypothetical protein
MIDGLQKPIRPSRLAILFGVQFCLIAADCSESPVDYLFYRPTTPSILIIVIQVISILLRQVEMKSQESFCKRPSQDSEVRQTTTNLPNAVANVIRCNLALTKKTGALLSGAKTIRKRHRKSR